MLNLIKKFLRPTLRQQLEDGVREALRNYADRNSVPDLRVYVSTDLVPVGVDPGLWAADEAAHLRGFAVQWARDNGIGGSGFELEVVMLDTKREFAFVKTVGPERERAREKPLVAHPPPSGGSGEAVLEVVSSPALREPLRVKDTLTVGRKKDGETTGVGDRYMSARHARFYFEDGRFWVTDLDSKNRTFVNEEPIPPHEPRDLRDGDSVKMGNTTLRVSLK
ncbi:MAG: FHA domain-containing protein [Longimicrobiaceae bacterium]